MKKILKLSLISICLLNIVSCNSDGLNKYRRNNQLVDLDYLALNEKLVQDESFVFYLTSKGCPGCKAFYPEVEEFLKENKDVTLYTLKKDDISEVDKLTLAAYYADTLGNSYFTKNDLNSLSLYTPSICKVVNGEFVYAQIGHLNKEVVSYMYQDNYLSFDSYYMYNRKVQKKETFNVFISKNGDAEYDASLREYFINNSSYSGYYLNIKDFDESENERLLNRINYYLGEENTIEEYPEYCLLQYEDGKLVNYTNIKYDSSSLVSLYNK